MPAMEDDASNAPNRSANGEEDEEVVDATSFPCDFSYHLYYRTGPKNKPVWKSSSSKKKIEIKINPDTMTLASLCEELQKICNGKTDKLGDMVMADLIPNILQIELGCWISKVPGYLKNCGRVLTDEDSFTVWAGRACRFQSSNRRAALEWTMEKPVDEAAKAKEAAGVAKTIRTIPRPLENGDPGPRVMDDVEDNINFEKMLTKIALKGSKDVSIDRHIDVFCMPGDLSRYVLMTSGHITEWAKDAVILPLIFHRLSHTDT